MNREGEFENSMSGIFIPPPSPHLNHRYDNDLVSSSSMSRASRQSEYSHSNSFSNGFDFSNDASYSSPFEKSLYLRRSTGLLFNSNASSYSQTNEELVNDLGLPESFFRMQQEEGARIRGFDRDSYGIVLGNGSFWGAISYNLESTGQYEDFNNDTVGYEASRSCKSAVPVSSNGDMRFKPLRFRQGYIVGDETGSPLTLIHSTSRSSSPSFNDSRMSYILGQPQEQNVGRCFRDAQLQNPISRSDCDGDFVCSQLHGNDSNGGKSFTCSFCSSHLLQPNLGENMRSPLHNLSVMEEWTRANPRGEVPPVFRYEQCAGDLEDFTFEDSFIIEGKCLSDVMDSSNGTSISNERDKSFSLDSHFPRGKIGENKWSSSNDSQLPCPPIICSLDELRGYIHYIAKDQYGCRTLQMLFDQGTSKDVQIIFDGIIDHVVELSMNPFGNYLVQKLLDVCCKEQKLQIVLVMTQEPGQLVEVSLNTHGSRVVQKFIETSEDRDLIHLIMSALEPGFLQLVKNLNGNHVVQRCLQCLSNEDNSLIFHAAAKYCIDIATHQHGCCVLQWCISYSTGKHQDKLVTEITNNALFLAQDPYGNYVIQFIIELRLPSATAKLASQFKGNYEYLSMQKFSSHVVEKCLKHVEEIRPSIINELLSVSHFDHLLEHPFANYVIRSALEVTKGTGTLHDSLVRALRPYMMLRTSPFCKKIFSKNLLRK
ncbi:putative pumilio homolog 7, chloroplastic [Humulus lupulus]|uniref:putative pumilio homolog 7, chloroplastic n=1 Tax=Humulus lupulus TaxID=3486 RepID=UPI002B41062F|nr:putative pumilio homolog 7, chloroplastic [Humulus lupulus]